MLLEPKSLRVLIKLYVCRKLREKLFLTIFIFCPSFVDSFTFSPIVGASSRLITNWNSSLLTTNMVQINMYAITTQIAEQS